MQSEAAPDPRVSNIVSAALRKPQGDREAYVRIASQGDEHVFRGAMDALAREEGIGDYLRQPGDASEAATVGMPSSLAPGAAIGPYRLLQKIGEGGMAQVWLAEQTTPVHRSVAIKLIKTGMDTKAMVARFESERQALALMDHPAIARIFDASATPEGRPYFVMEYVPGVPITEYCDKYCLSTRARLELFMQVCEGVQHAHQKAIIHRDLKPSNVLVAVQDGKPLPKIIDFGVAKALAQRLTEKTMFTEMGVLVGTPEYMSPEQAEMTGQNIDTRTDVYSLGLILYELLVGALPFENKELRRAGFEEMLRRIREEDPPRPSTKVRTLGDASATAARNRKTEPKILARQLQGDLDWIAIKALEKDRTRRYGSPSELAAEIGRYLRDEPVLASPPSLAYRTGKFARRHRFGVGAAAGVMLLLLGFAITMAVQAQRITRERDRANREAQVSRRVTEFLTGLFTVSDPGQARGNSITAREILDKGARQIDNELRDQPETQAQLMHIMGVVYGRLGLEKQGQPLLERAVETRRKVLGPQHSETIDSMFQLAWLYMNRGRYNEAEKISRTVLEVRERTLGPDHANTFRARNLLARVMSEQHRYLENSKMMEAELPRARRLLGPDDLSTLESTMILAIAYSNLNRRDEADRLFREVVASRRRILGPDHPSTMLPIFLLGDDLMREKRYPEAEQIFKELLEVQRRVLGPAQGETIETLSDLAEVYAKQHRYADAERLNREAVETSLRAFPGVHPITANMFYNLAWVVLARGRRDEAIDDLRKSVEHGFRDLDQMENDEDLKSLRGDPRFNAILAQVRKLAAAK